MAEEKKQEMENKRQDVKDTTENRETVVDSEKKKEKKMSKSAIEKAEKKAKQIEGKVELEREYIVPLRKGFLNVPQYRRAKKAVRVLKEFVVRHMNIRDGDRRKVKVNIHLNNEIWFRGIKNPLHKIKIKAKKIDGIVYVELADPADYVKFKIAREEKAKAASEVGKKAVKPAKKEKTDVDKDKDGVVDVVEEKEDVKAEAEADAKFAKGKVKAGKHTAEGKHTQQVASEKGLK